MNKTELLEQIASTAEITKSAAGRALDAVLGAIAESLKKGEDVTLVGFGTFLVRKRAARKGRNPQTGDEIMIEAVEVPSFRASKALKSTVNYGKKKNK